MNRRTENERLLQDVLAGGAEHDFRDASLQDVLRLVQRRRKMRLVRKAGVAAIVLVAVAIGGMRYLNPKQTRPQIAQSPAPTMPKATFAWVTSRSLSAAELVTNQPLVSEQIVTTVAAPNIVHSIPGNYREVGDEELLALAAPQVVALVRRSPHEAELLFVSGLAHGPTDH